MRKSLFVAAILLAGAGLVAAQVPPGFMIVTTATGAGNTGGVNTGLYLVDPAAGTATPVTGTSTEVAGIVGGVPTANAGANAVMIDDVTGNLIVGTIAPTATATYSVREIALDPTGTAVLTETIIGSKPSAGTLSGIQALTVLPNGNILAIEATLGAPLGTIGLFEYSRTGGTITPWATPGLPTTQAANAMWFDSAGLGGVGEVIIGIIGTGNVLNDIYSVPYGGGAATLLASWNNNVLVTGASGIPTGITADGTGDLVISHNNVACGSTRFNRAINTATALAPGAFVTGQNALCYDPANDDIILVGNATGASTTNISRQVRRLDLTTATGSVIAVCGSPTNPPAATAPGGNTNGVDTRNGARIYGRACNSAGAGVMSIGTTSSANLGNPAFGIRCTGGTAFGSGLLVAGLAAGYIDLSGLGYPGCASLTSMDLLVMPIGFDGFGNFVLPAPLPTGPFAGIAVYIQFADGSFAPTLGISAGLKVTLF